MSCSLCHRGVHLILAYSWTRPGILVAGKGRGMFLFLLFLHFHSCSSFFPVPLFHLFYYFFYLFSPFLWGWRVVKSQTLSINQLIHKKYVLGTHEKCLREALLMSTCTNNICFLWRNISKKPYTGLSSSVGWVSNWWLGGCGFDPHRVGNILSWRLIMKYFLQSVSPFRWFKKGSHQFLVKECTQYWLTP